MIGSVWFRSISKVLKPNQTKNKLVQLIFKLLDVFLGHNQTKLTGMDQLV